MKYIKSFGEINETLKNSHLGVNLRKSFDKPTEPKEPFKRNLTQEEKKIMRRHFNNHSWSSIDADGKIVLGGGEDSAGKYYITEEDLKKLVKNDDSDKK